MDNTEDEYICKTAETTKYVAQLVEDYFEYVCETAKSEILQKKEIVSRAYSKVH